MRVEYQNDEDTLIKLHSHPDNVIIEIHNLPIRYTREQIVKYYSLKDDVILHIRLVRTPSLSGEQDTFVKFEGGTSLSQYFSAGIGADNNVLLQIVDPGKRKRVSADDPGISESTSATPLLRPRSKKKKRNEESETESEAEGEEEGKEEGEKKKRGKAIDYSLGQVVRTSLRRNVNINNESIVAKLDSEGAAVDAQIELSDPTPKPPNSVRDLAVFFEMQDHHLYIRYWSSCN